MLTEELKLDSKTLQTAITLAELMSFTWHMVRFPDQDWFDKQKEWALRLTK
jgi:hypothetical protein